MSTEISFEAAARLIPDFLYNLSKTPPKLQESGRVLVNEPTTEKALVASYQPNTQYVFDHAESQAWTWDKP